MPYDINAPIIKGGKRFYDTPIGVLCLETFFPKLIGHVRNPRTYDFPTITHVVKGVDIPKLLFNPTPDLLAPFVEAAIYLEKEGVHAITGSCGFLARFQKEISEAVNIPVFMSSLLQIPLIRAMHGNSANIGVLTASGKALKPEHFNSWGGDINSVFIKGMEGNEEFENTILAYNRFDFQIEKLEKEIVGTALGFIEEKKLDALLLECTDLPPFARQIQQQSSIPVYDINSLVRMVESAVRWKF